METDLKMKDDLVQDRELSKGLIVIRDTPTGLFEKGYTSETKSLCHQAQYRGCKLCSSKSGTGGNYCS